MADLSTYPITRKWPAQHPERLQLYSVPTPNGVKVSVMLEETGLPYEPHLVRFEELKQKLEQEGLFDESRKRQLPRFPRRIGVVTSESGAVFHDICHVLERRWPLAASATA